jgi:hypothetical protein
VPINVLLPVVANTDETSPLNVVALLAYDAEVAFAAYEALVAVKA